MKRKKSDVWAILDADPPPAPALGPNGQGVLPLTWDQDEVDRENGMPTTSDLLDLCAAGMGVTILDDGTVVQDTIESDPPAWEDDGMAW